MGYVLNNPLSFNDPTGELAWFIPVIIGAVIGGGTAAIKGGNFGDILQGAFIGRLAGLAGFGVGNLAGGVGFFSSQLTVTGFAQGFTVGFLGGFAGGFVGGAANSWMNGGSFGDGIVAGVMGGSIAGMTGGLIGGISGGIRAKKMGLDFWDGGITKESVAMMQTSGYNPDSPIPATDANLIKARKAWIPDAPIENVNKFTVENVPEAMQQLMDDNNALAATPYLRKNGLFTGKSNMYFSDRAFSSAKELYYTMVHEFNHVSQHALLSGLPVANFKNSLFGHVKEFTAYSHGTRLGSSNYGGYGSGGAFFDKVPSIVQHSWFAKFQPYNFSWTKTVNYAPLQF